MPQPDTPTLSPADRARVDAQINDVWYHGVIDGESELDDPSPRSLAARAALTATVAALVAEAEARGREAGAGGDVEHLLDVLAPDYLGDDERVLAERERIAARYRACKDRGMSFTASARTARAEWLRSALRAAPTPTPHAAWCSTRSLVASSTATPPCNCATPTPTEGDPR